MENVKKKGVISQKDRTLSWREQELRKTRADILKYQKERMSRSQELAEVRHSIVKKVHDLVHQSKTLMVSKDQKKELAQVSCITRWN